MYKACRKHTMEAKRYKVTITKPEAMGNTWHIWDVILKLMLNKG
jgi:hypothetical protein